MIPRIFQHRLHLGRALAHRQRFDARKIDLGLAGRQKSHRHDDVVRVAAHDRIHHRALIDRRHDRAPQLHVVGRRNHVIRPQLADETPIVEPPDLHVRRPLQHRQQIGHRHFQPVHFAGGHRVRRGRGIGNHLPLHAIHQHAMTARGEARRLIARHVTLERHHRGVAADHVLVRQKSERPAADRLGHLLVRIGAVGDALRHHHRRGLEFRQQRRQARGISSSAAARSCGRPAPPAHQAEPPRSRRRDRASSIAAVTRCSRAPAPSAPSWNHWFSRSVITQRLPSSSMT